MSKNFATFVVTYAVFLWYYSPKPKGCGPSFPSLGSRRRGFFGLRRCAGLHTSSRIQSAGWLSSACDVLHQPGLPNGEQTSCKPSSLALALSLCLSLSLYLSLSLSLPILPGCCGAWGRASSTILVPLPWASRLRLKAKACIVCCIKVGLCGRKGLCTLHNQEHALVCMQVVARSRNGCKRTDSSLLKSTTARERESRVRSKQRGNTEYHFIHLPMCPSIHPSACSSINPSTRPSIHLPIQPASLTSIRSSITNSFHPARGLSFRGQREANVLELQ